MREHRSWVGRVWDRRFEAAALRIGLVCALIVGVCLVQLSLPGASEADTSFSPGTATAASQGIEVEPTTGALSYAPILANALADYENQESQALAETFDPGALIEAAQGPSCSTGAPSSFPQSDDPQPLEVESTNGNTSQSMSAENSLNGTGAGVGVETASATTQPDGTAMNTLGSDNLAGVITTQGVTTNANAQLANGDEREATATADMSSLSLDGGKVVMGGMAWSATQTSGATSSSTATFTISNLTIAGLPIPITNDSPATITSLINTALGPTGFNITWPQTITQTDGTVVITPMQVGVDNSALGQQAVGTNLASGETVRNELQSELLAINCNSASGLTVADVSIGVLAGGGDLNFQLGGAHAVTTSESFVSPFSAVSLPATTGNSGASVSTLPATTGNSGSFASPGTPATPGTPGGLVPSGPTTPTPTSAAGGQAVALGPVSLSRYCHSLSTAGGGCHSDGALIAGLVGVSLLGGLAAWEVQRRRRLHLLHLPPTEES
jgi:hypothetical protein